MFLNCGVGEVLRVPWTPRRFNPSMLKEISAEISFVFIGRTDAKAETPVLWTPDAKSWLIWRDPDVGTDWRWEEKRTTEDEMARWNHQLNGHAFGSTPGVGDEHGGLECCSRWGHKESDRTEQLNWTKSLLLTVSSLSIWALDPWFQYDKWIHLLSNIFYP